MGPVVVSARGPGPRGPRGVDAYGQFTLQGYNALTSSSSSALCLSIWMRVCVSCRKCMCLSLFFASRLQFVDIRFILVTKYHTLCTSSIHNIALYVTIDTTGIILLL